MVGAYVVSQRLVERYGIRAEPPADRVWGIRDFIIVDPAGVLWRIGKEITTEDSPKL